jgi:hypothetical protein
VELRYTIHDPLLAAQFTTRERARVIQEALRALRSRVRAGSLMLAYEGTTTFQYLVDTRPYLNRSWPMRESPSVLRDVISAVPKQHACLPVTIRARGSSRTRLWPRDVRKGLEQKEPDRGDRALISGFLKDHGYEVVWRNAFFEILEPRRLKPNDWPRCR